MLNRADYLILSAAVLAFLLSVWLWFVSQQREAGLFVAVWVPSIFGAAIYVRQSLQIRADRAAHRAANRKELQS